MFERSAGAKILVFSRDFIPSFMKVTWRHSCTLFRPLSVKETTFSGCSRCLSLPVFGHNMPPGSLSMYKKRNLQFWQKWAQNCKICDLFRWRSFSWILMNNFFSLYNAINVHSNGSNASGIIRICPPGLRHTLYASNQLMGGGVMHLIFSCVKYMCNIHGHTFLTKKQA